MKRALKAGSVKHADVASVTMIITLNGGSLSLCVDEECSQLCELMRIAGHFEHRLLERTLRSLAIR